MGNDVMWGTGGARGLPIDASASAYTSGPIARVNLSWTSLESGQSVSMNGLTFTASRYLSADEVASAWSNLSTTSGTPASTDLGRYSGVWGNTWTTGASTAQQLTVLATDETARWDLLGTMGTNNGPVRDNNLFVWQAGDAQGGAVDVIKDFVVWNAALPGTDTKGDRLDIRALIQGYTLGDGFSNWLNFSQDTVNGVANSTRIDIDTNGFATAGGDLQTIWLEGVNLGADLSALQTGPQAGFIVMS
jgi:hypothetical protein